MKAPQKLKWIILLLIAIVFTQSCQKDELPPENQIADTNDVNPGTDSSTPDDNDSSDNSDDDSNSNIEGEEGDITLYTVQGTNLVKARDYKVTGTALEFQRDVEKHQEIWLLLKKIIPENYIAKISDFMIFAGEESGTAGYVFPTSADLSTWRMGIAIDFAYEGGFNANGELAYTLIHEFGHILTLDNLQVDSSISESNCENYFVGEGCSKKQAYINKLQRQYWADIWGDFQNAQEDFEKLDAFYNTHQDRFVTNYAATNPGEDIAEVFATFVTRNGGVNGNSIAEQKIQLMYDHPEIIQLRNFIRGNMESSKNRSFMPVAGAWRQAKSFGYHGKGCIHTRRPK